MSKKNIIILVVAIVILVVGVAAAMVVFKPEANVEGTLEEIMEKVYAGIADEEKPMMLMNVEVNAENVEGFLGTADVKYKEALASESGVGSIAHSVVLVRCESAADAEVAAAKIKETANPRKWICVTAENVTVERKGDLVILIMSNTTLGPKLEANFGGLV